MGGLLRLLRWPGALTAGANAATGFLLAHGPGSPSGTAVAAGVVAGGVLVYAGGAALNDAADAERDRTLHPERPIPSGRVGRRAAAVFAFVLLAAGIAVVFALAGPWPGAAATLAAVAAAAYDLGGKALRVPGALLMGLARGANGAAGALAGAGGLALLAEARPEGVLLYPLALLVYTATLTWISTYEERRPGPARLGAFAVALAVVAALPWALLPPTTLPAAPAFALLPLVSTYVIAAREARDPGGPGVGALVRVAVFGFLLVDSAWLFAQGRNDAGFWLLLAYMALRLLLARARS